MMAPEFGFMIDAGEGVASSIGIGMLNSCRNVFITHSHWDHTAGLIQALNLRRRQSEDGTLTVWHPPGPKFESIRRLVGRGVNWEALGEGQEIDVAKNLYISPFPVSHRGAVAFGFHCMERRSRRKAEYAGMGPDEISAMISESRRKGEAAPVVSEPYDAHLFAYTGDTEPLERGKIGRPEILFHDSTYLPGMEREAIECGHSSMGHAIAAKEESGAGLLVCLHVSPRHHGELPTFGRDILVPPPRLGFVRFQGGKDGYSLAGTGGKETVRSPDGLAGREGRMRGSGMRKLAERGRSV